MTLLNDLLATLSLSSIPNPAVGGLCLDSRQLTPGDVFLAYPGAQTDGRNFMEKAASAGASAILYEPLNLTQTLPTSCPAVAVPELQKKISHLAEHFHGNPSHALTVIGITGTNGKTSVSHYLAQALSHCQHPCGIIGTLGVGMPLKLTHSDLTTPNAIACTQAILACHNEGATHVAMEVSSHALDQHRVKAIRMPIAIFTNLSQDHLDYHGSFEAYRKAKARLWEQTGLETAIINWDDPTGQTWLNDHDFPVQHIAYSCDPQASITTPAVQLLNPKLAKTPWGNVTIEHSLIGDFNTSNVLAVVAALGCLGIAPDHISQAVKKLTAVPGRMETISHDSGLRVVIDYAHTPDALEKALSTLRPLTDGKLICVFGCGGNRDQRKRPLMGAIAEKKADFVIITNDNPRLEEPNNIARDIAAGMTSTPCIILDRAEAIEKAISQANSNDVVLIAGKGHETGQHIGSKTIPFNDTSYANIMLKNRKK